MLPKLALFALAVQQIAAFKIPAGAVDGFYRAWVDTDGTEHQELVTEALPAGESKRSYPAVLSSVQKRDNDIHCGCGRRLAGGDCDNAVTDLRGQLGSGASITGHTAYYAIRGDVVVFVCNPSAYTATISGNDAANAFAHITRECGYYIAGTESHETNIGYMLKYENGGNFCGAAAASSAHHC